MRSTVQKCLACLLACLMLFSLVACKDGDKQEETTTVQPAPGAAPEETTTQNGNNGTPTPDQNPDQDAPKPPEVGEDGELEMPEIPI